jgi:hypothetical protein
MEEKLHEFFRQQTTISDPTQKFGNQAERNILKTLLYLQTDLPTDPSMRTA